MINSSVAPWVLPVSIGGGVFLVLILVLVLVCIVSKKKKKPKQKRIKVDDAFIQQLLNLLGGKENIQEVSVDNGRLKFKVIDLDKTNLEGLQGIASSGVFVTGNIIKTLFMLDSQTIKDAVEDII